MQIPENRQEILERLSSIPDFSTSEIAHQVYEYIRDYDEQPLRHVIWQQRLQTMDIIARAAAGGHLDTTAAKNRRIPMSGGREKVISGKVAVDLFLRYYLQPGTTLKSIGQEYGMGERGVSEHTWYVFSSLQQLYPDLRRLHSAKSLESQYRRHR